MRGIPNDMRERPFIRKIMRGQNRFISRSLIKTDRLA